MDEHTIAKALWTEFTDGIAKLNKKARKLGVAGVSYAVLGEDTVETTKDGRRVKIAVRRVTVTGAAVRLAGWALVAKIEPLKEGTNLVHTVPGETVGDRFRQIGSVCEHCNTARRRNETFVVRGQDGSEKAVGRNCLADYTGLNQSPEAVASALGWWKLVRDFEASLREEWGAGGWAGRANTLDLVRVLSVTSAIIRRYGWVSRTQAMSSVDGTQSTAALVREHLTGRGGSADGLRAEAKVTEADEAAATDTIRWVREEAGTRSEYEHNLKAIFVDETVATEHLGLACSAVSAMLRAKEKAVARQREAAAGAGSKAVGKVGERLRALPATVLAIRMMQGSFGPTTLVKLADEQGNVLSWFASSHVEQKPGDRVRVTGTVKAHKVFNGAQETQLGRCILATA